MSEETKQKKFNKPLFFKYFISITLVCAILGFVLGFSLGKPKQTMNCTKLDHTENTITATIKIGKIKTGSKSKTIKTSDFLIFYEDKIINAATINKKSNSYEISGDISETIITVVFYIPKTDNDLSNLEEFIKIRYKGNWLKLNEDINVIL